MAKEDPIIICLLLNSNIRIPGHIYRDLWEIKLDLEDQYSSAAPSLQNMTNLALEKFIADWRNPELQSKLTNELIERRRNARSRQGPQTRAPKSPPNN